MKFSKVQTKVNFIWNVFRTDFVQRCRFLGTRSHDEVISQGQIDFSISWTCPFWVLTSYQTVTSNVLGLVVSANLSDTTYGWHGYVTGMSLYYYHWSQIPMERQQLMLTSDMVLATSLGMRKTALLGNPYTPCSRSETHYQCDLQ